MALSFSTQSRPFHTGDSYEQVHRLETFPVFSDVTVTHVGYTASTWTGGNQFNKATYRANRHCTTYTVNTVSSAAVFTQHFRDVHCRIHHIMA